MKLWAVVVLACTISSFSFADTSTNSFKTPAGQTVTIGDQVQDMQKKNRFIANFYVLYPNQQCTE